MVRLKLYRSAVCHSQVKRWCIVFITDLGVLDITPQGVKLIELAPDVSFDEIRKVTGVALQKVAA